RGPATPPPRAGARLHVRRAVGPRHQFRLPAGQLYLRGARDHPPIHERAGRVGAGVLRRVRRDRGDRRGGVRAARHAGRGGAGDVVLQRVRGRRSPAAEHPPLRVDDGEAIAAAGALATAIVAGGRQGGPDCWIPSCPAWRMADLVPHVAVEYAVWYYANLTA